MTTLRLLGTAHASLPAVFLDLFSGASAPALRKLGVLCVQPIDLLRGSGVDFVSW